MGWAFCGTDDLGREIGYGIEATCDAPDCETKIDRGLGYVCGEMHGGDEHSCGGYFCGEHLYFGGPNQMCGPCLDEWMKLHPEGDE